MAKQIKITAALLIFLIFLLIFLFHSNIITELQFTSKILGIAIAIINYALFLSIFKFSLKNDNKNFLMINLGGMAFRILLMLIMIFIIVKFLKIDTYRFIFTFFIIYFLLLVNELYIVINIISRKSSGNLKDVI